MIIAIPVADGRLHGHFGGCTHFTLVDADREHKSISSTRTLEAPPHAPGAFPRWLREQKVNAVIVGGIGRRALGHFAVQGIEVRAGTPGTPVDELVTSYLNGTLLGAPKGCATHGHHHDHAHEHHHHHHHHHGQNNCKAIPAEPNTQRPN